ncbi:P2X purinoceptor 7-like [Cyprinodon tularosa]|nr:P2X purinoceptor 7-like [Cyprinodon tularosa]
MRADRIANEDARIQSLDLQQAREILRGALTRDPSLMFDLAHRTSGPPGPQPQPPAAQPTWCVCTNCKEMPTDIERKCCGEPADSCIAMMQHMDEFILLEGILYFAGRIWAEVRAEADVVGPGESNRRFRHAAYRQFVVWQYGALGHGRRVVIPSCCVWRIRDRYPDPLGQYRGFVASRV